MSGTKLLHWYRGLHTNEQYLTCFMSSLIVGSVYGAVKYSKRMSSEQIGLVEVTEWTVQSQSQKQFESAWNRLSLFSQRQPGYEWCRMYRLENGTDKRLIGVQEDLYSISGGVVDAEKPLKYETLRDRAYKTIFQQPADIQIENRDPSVNATRTIADIDNASNEIQKLYSTLVSSEAVTKDTESVPTYISVRLWRSPEYYRRYTRQNTFKQIYQSVLDLADLSVMRKCITVINDGVVRSIY